MTPLSHKLQMKPGHKWLIYKPPMGYLASLKPLPEGATCTSRPAGEFDGIQLFAKNKTDLSAALRVIVPLLRPKTILWVSYPKKSSGITSDLGMENWEEMKTVGLEGVASISVDETWSGSRFRPLGQMKKSGTANSDIRKSQYAAYIDVGKKTITPPPDIQQLLHHHPQASQFFQQLSYTNKKEYLLWILTAKQEKTRAERLTRMLEKLAAGKKNPAEK